MSTLIHGENFSDVYKQLLERLLNKYEYITCPRGLLIKEITNCILEIDNPESNLFTNTFRGIPLKYLRDELKLYLSGRNDFDGFVKASAFWGKIANPDGTINSAYGYLIFKNRNKFGKTQYEWAHECLLTDKDTRQAIMHFNLPEHQWSNVRDFPCTLNAIFNIRDDKLNLTICMRSNDVRKGLQFDIPFFTLVQKLMYLSLKGKYPTLKMGTYTHVANSMHMYQPDFVLAETMLGHEFAPASMPSPDTDEVILSDVYYKDNIKLDNYSTNKDFYTWILSN